jgi:tRNA G37 N-methylase Trm5
MSVNIVPVINCHCLSPANKYFTRTFINQLNYKVFRAWYKCTNCKSRIFRDYSPEMDAVKKVNVFDLIKQDKTTTP